MTSTRFQQTQDWLKGSSADEANEDEFMIWTFGGEVENIAQKVPGEAALLLDEEIMLFIGEGNDDHQRVIGMSQGAYPLERPKAGPRLIRSRHLPNLVGPRKGPDAPELERPAVEILHEAPLKRAFSLIRSIR